MPKRIPIACSQISSGLPVYQSISNEHNKNKIAYVTNETSKVFAVDLLSFY